MSARLDLFLQVLGAMGFERHGDSFFHVKSGRELKARWNEEVLSDLVHFHGINAESEVCLAIIIDAWGVANELISNQEILTRIMGRQG